MQPNPLADREVGPNGDGAGLKSPFPYRSRKLRNENTPGMMDAEFPPSPRGGVDLRQAGRIYRPRENIAGGQMRRKCAKADKDFKCGRYAATDGAYRRTFLYGGHRPASIRFNFEDTSLREKQ